VNGVAGLASPFFNFNRKRLIDLCSQYRLPSICTGDLPDMWLKSSKVRKPSELPVQQPIRFELAVSLKTAKTLGVTLPASLIGRADEVVE